jgi:hypothetical protein
MFISEVAREWMRIGYERGFIMGQIQSLEEAMSLPQQKNFENSPPQNLSPVSLAWRRHGKRSTGLHLHT